ncbi:MAG: energy transducer TonB [Bacteroidales bacterium]|jgi:protein TonB|nr:energy transducer TonB [Bacteroidales bacterium]
MEIKKSDKANLENKKGLFLEIGLIVALSLIMFAFEYRSFDKGDDEQVIRRDDVAIENIDIPQTENTPPPPPEEIPPAEPTEFEITSDDMEINNDFNVGDMFANTANVGPVISKKDISNEEDLEKEEEIVLVVEEQAVPPEDLDLYIQKNLVYPEAARQAGITGNVIVNFVIEKDGSLSNIKIIRDIGGGCGEAVVKLFQNMPKWKPAKQRGKAVRNQFGKTVRFSLNN